jgi:hypothetical protein
VSDRHLQPGHEGRKEGGASRTAHWSEKSQRVGHGHAFKIIDRCLGAAC